MKREARQCGREMLLFVPVPFEGDQGGFGVSEEFIAEDFGANERVPLSMPIGIGRYDYSSRSFQRKPRTHASP